MSNHSDSVIGTLINANTILILSMSYCCLRSRKDFSCLICRTSLWEAARPHAAGSPSNDCSVTTYSPVDSCRQRVPIPCKYAVTAVSATMVIVVARSTKKSRSCSRCSSRSNRNDSYSQTGVWHLPTLCDWCKTMLAEYKRRLQQYNRCLIYHMLRFAKSGLVSSAHG